ncbi:hypothetical protein BDV96DRAFT_83551 [Lophiotrema nucula]|uniref:Uncharacterized protein n=1 Tax=Lophiotrema nucula TaxID=690887 RepID=A0A6A5Z7D3_9PLEO|nr:hypothetical protein BDV96DRAFT_83551 [Lophiotrema nucula]
MASVQSRVVDQPPMKAKSHFRFLDLPAELRVIIYEEVVVVGKIYYTPDQYDYHNGIRHLGTFRKPELQFLRVCKQIHSEVEKIYLSKNLFVLPIGWEESGPFNTSPNRSLFSPAGFHLVKNISIALDQRMSKVKNPLNHLRWKFKENRKGFLFHRLSADERLKFAHDWVLDDVFEDWLDTLHQLKQFERVDYIEVDFTNAFCPLGDCRPILSVIDGWMFNLAPEVVDVIGLQPGEEIHFDDEHVYGYATTEHKFDLYFREPGQVTEWDKWQLEEEDLKKTDV